MSDLRNQIVETGNSIKFMVNNKSIGMCQSINATRDFGLSGIYAVGSYMPYEHVKLKFDGSLNADRYRLRKNDLTTLGIAGYGVDVLNQGVINISVLTTDTDKVVEVFMGCSSGNYNTKYGANEVVSESISFKYISAAKPN